LTILGAAWALCMNGAWADPSQLAAELFAEGDMEACLVEAARARKGDPSNDRAALLEAAARLRVGREVEDALAALAERESSDDPDVRFSASYERGRALWAVGRMEEAYASLANALLTAPDRARFLRSACTLFLFFEDAPSFRERDPALVMQMNTSRALWTGRLFAECRLPKPAGGALLGKPGQWLVSFYRTQVSPAIGARCSCHPSCSEYFKQACAKHGLLGFAMQADRFFREPDVVKEGKHPVRVGGAIKYYDPVSDHDFWMQP